MAEVVNIGCKVSVELPIFLLFVAFMLGDAVWTNMIIYRTCYITLGYNESECALLGSQNKDNMTDSLEKLVQPHATVIKMSNGLFLAVFHSILCLLLGPWSDKFGRKPILVSSLLGVCINHFLNFVISTIPNASPWFFLISGLPSLGLGGMSSFITVGLCYITDITTEKNRGIRMTIFEASVGIGMLIGSVCSSFLLQEINYIGVFLTCTILVFIGLLYTVFMIPETVSNIQGENYFKSLFALGSLKEVMKTTFKQRENYSRAIIILCLLILTIFVSAIIADGTVIFMYLRERFGWSLRHYTLYSSAIGVVGGIGTFIGVYGLNKLLQVPETVLLLMGFLSMFNGSLLQGLATKDWHIYFAGAIKLFGGVLSPMIRSLISKVVTQEEVGKIFALTLTLEMLSSMIATPIYTAIYNNTIYTMPQLFNYVTAGLFLLNIIFTVAIIMCKYLDQSSSISYQTFGINGLHEN